MAPTLGEQFERLLRATLLVFILAAACFLSAVSAVRIAIRGRIIAMPNVVGQTAVVAQQTLAAKRLQFKVADRVYSTLPLNVVVGQSPSAGESIKVPQDAHVVLSLGPQSVMIPALGGRSMRAARITLLESNLQLGEVSSVYMPASDADTVVAQYPPPASAAPSPRVDVLVAEGERARAYVMPALVGLQQADAERILAAAGLHIAKVNHIAESDSPKGTVIGQTPPRGARIAGDATVELGVADKAAAVPSSVPLTGPATVPATAVPQAANP
jgi:eukaryotic-like serine/threonine-protein kinase